MVSRSQMAPRERGPSPLLVAGCVFALSVALLFAGMYRPSAATPPAMSTTQSSTPTTRLPPTSQFVEPMVAAAIGETQRSEQHAALDAERDPQAVLAFARVAPGMRVLEWAGGSGYFTELLARAVGPDGRVYVTGLANRALPARLGNVVPVSDALRELPDESVDLVFSHAHYHRLVAQGVDRDRTLREAHRVLQLGGALVVIDHAAREGSGKRDAARLQRIDEQVVRADVLRSGFLFEEATDVLRRPADDAHRAALDPALRGAVDRFTLRFVRVGALETAASSERAPRQPVGTWR